MQWLPGRLILITPLLILSSSEGREETWSVECPHECSCHLSHLKDLPMRKWLVEESTGQKSHSQETFEYNNEALYPDDTIPKDHTDEANDLMRMAICILQKDTEPSELLEQLPSNLEVLTFLQSSDSEFVTLGENIFDNHLDLIALEIQGFHGYGDGQVSGHHGNSITSHYPLDEIAAENHSPKERITLHIESIQHLHSLQYLNLQYVEIEGNGYLFQDDSRPIPLQSANYKYDVHEHDYELQTPNHPRKISHNLVFLSPEPEEEILPYRRYRQEQENLKSSIYIGLPNLVFLRLYACGLKDVNWRMFDGLPQLEYLSLEGNELRFIPEFTFYGAPNMKILSLAYNKLLSLQSTSLAGLLDLRKLDLSHNNFSHLSELSLPPFPHLKIADFRHNPIETVFSSTFEIMNATEILYLGGDERGIEISQHSFSGLTSLLRLFIYNVNIDKIERVTLVGMPALKELEMKGSIRSIEFDAFAEVPKLEILTLKHCQVKTISMDAFFGIYQLIYLDLSYNELEILPPGIFDQQSSLKELLLQNNKFKELPDRVFQNLQAKMIRLDGNPWHCSCSMMDWRETSINKVKEHSTPMCQNHYDKGISCRQSVNRYVYDKRVAPQCETPVKYKNWSVFHVMRKVLRCKKYKEKHNEIKKLYGNYISRQGVLGKNPKVDESAVEIKLNPTNENDKTQPSRAPTSLPKQEANEKEIEITTTQLTPKTSQENFTSHATEATADNQFSTPSTREKSKVDEQITSTREVSTTKRIKLRNENLNVSHTIPNKMLESPNRSTVTEINMHTNQNSTVEIRNNNLQNDLLSFLHQNYDRLSLQLPSLNHTSSDHKNILESGISKKHKIYKKQGDTTTNEREYSLFDGNKRIKVSKKAYKLEMERQARERLRAN